MFRRLKLVVMEVLITCDARLLGCEHFGEGYDAGLRRAVPRASSPSRNGAYRAQVEDRPAAAITNYWARPLREQRDAAQAGMLAHVPLFQRHPLHRFLQTRAGRIVHQDVHRAEAADRLFYDKPRVLDCTLAGSDDDHPLRIDLRGGLVDTLFIDVGDDQGGAFGEPLRDTSTNTGRGACHDSDAMAESHWREAVARCSASSRSRPMAPSARISAASGEKRLVSTSYPPSANACLVGMYPAPPCEYPEKSVCAKGDSRTMRSLVSVN